MIKALIRLGFVVALLSARVAAQSMTTDAPVNLREQPSTAAHVKQVLPSLSKVTRLAGPVTGGFVHVKAGTSDGWVYQDYLFDDGSDTLDAGPRAPGRVISLDAPMDTLSETWERPPVSKTTLKNKSNGPLNGKSCGPRGEPGEDGATFLLKNRADVPAISYAVTFKALTHLPYETGGLSKDRIKVGQSHGWTPGQLREVQRFEGIPLTVTGFLAAVKPQKSNHEGTNCGWSGEENTDWHIAFVPGWKDDEPSAVVVEPTPRFKRHHPNWKPEKLADFAGSARAKTDSVRITGFLFYDPDHANMIGTFRRTMWELHPVTRIEVFVGGQWKDLDDFGPP